MRGIVVARTGCIAMCVSIGLSGVAAAGGSSVNDPKRDVQGDPCGLQMTKPCHTADYDFVKAKAKTAVHGKLVHTMKVAGHFGKTGGSGPSGSQPALLIDVPGGKKPPKCDYKVQPVPPGAPGNSSRVTKWLVEKCTNGPKTTVTGTAKAKRVSAHTDRITFLRKSIGRPSKYGWAAIFFGEGSAFDRAPNTGYIRLKVH